MQSFIFGADTGRTYKDIQRERALLDAMALRARPPKNVGEGLNALGIALRHRFGSKQLNKEEKAGRDQFNSVFQRVIGGQGGSSIAPPTEQGPSVPPGQAGDIPGNDGRSSLSLAVQQAESANDPNAVSPKGAQGLMQIMPATARDPGFGVQPAADGSIAENIRVGDEYLNAMLKRYNGDVDRALAAYNWGPGNADQWDGNPANLPEETRNYITTVKSNLSQFQGQPEPQQAPQPAQETESGSAGPISGLDPNLVQALASPYASPGQRAILQLMFNKQNEINDPIRTLQRRKLEAQINNLENPLANVKRGLQPQTGVDENGNPVLLQLGTDGTAVRTALPDGVRLSKSPIKLDAGTHFVLLDPVTRQPVGQIPKNVAGAAQERETGKKRAGAAFDLPQARVKTSQAVQTIDQLLEHPGLDGSVGTIQGRIPDAVAGAFNSNVADFRARLSQAQGKAFLEAYQMLRGGGQITEVEGQKAENALARLNQAVSEDAFKQALTDFRAAVIAGHEAIKRQAGEVHKTTPGTEAQRSDEDILKQYGIQ